MYKEYVVGNTSSSIGSIRFYMTNCILYTLENAKIT